MSNASRDENNVPTLLAASSSDGVTPTLVYADPTTHRLLVSGSGTVGTGTAGQVAWYESTGTNVKGTSSIFISGTNVGIGTTPNANAILDVSSTTKAVMLPRMTTAQKNAIPSPTEGMIVYDLTLTKLCFFNGATWQTVTST